MYTKDSKPKFGKIVIFNKEIDVKVTQWWGKGDKEYDALEVVSSHSENSIYFRETRSKGWRIYNKLTIPKYDKMTENIIIIFIPNS